MSQVLLGGSAMKRATIAICVSMVLISCLALAPAVAETTPTPTTTLYYIDGGPLWDTPLGCPANMALAEGPTWHGITIGKSSLADLGAVYGMKWTPTSVSIIRGNFAPLYVILLEDNDRRFLKLPGLAQACIVQNRVEALFLSTHPELTWPSETLGEWLKRFGKPEIVTWDSTLSEARIFVWPKEGVSIMVHISLQPEDMTIPLEKTVVSAVIFFPFARGSGYLSKWPYAQLPQNTPPTDTEYGKYDNPLLAKQNPFDFDTLLATVTIQSSQTPTSYIPTETPSPSSTPRP